MGDCTAFIIFIASIFFPGITTIVVGLFAGCDCTYVVVGIFQILLAPVFGVGIIWAWVWGARGLCGGSRDGERGLTDPDIKAPAPAASHV